MILDKYLKNVNINIIVFTENGKKYSPLGTILEQGNYINGKRQGHFKKFYSSGQMQELTLYQNALEVSETTEWYENGMLKSKGFYNVSCKEGEHIVWDDSGNMVEITFYVAGELWNSFKHKNLGYFMYKCYFPIASYVSAKYFK